MSHPTIMLHPDEVKPIVEDPAHARWLEIGNDYNLSLICQYLMTCDGKEGRLTYDKAFQFLFDAALFTDKLTPYVMLTEAKKNGLFNESLYWKTYHRPIGHMLGIECRQNADPPMPHKEGAYYMNSLLIHYVKLGYVSDATVKHTPEEISDYRDRCLAARAQRFENSA